jgi:hypothetical protein
MNLAIGARLGPYVIDGQLGAGGMGEVYRASDTRLGRLVAIKVLPRDITANAAARERFDREARTISALDHPNICTLFDVGEVDGAPFLVMQYLNGRTLAELVRDGPLPVSEVLRIGLDLASALLYAHERHILHRDIKPQNVMLLADGRAKLLDFGIAQRDLTGAVTIAETAAALTRAGSIIGTLEYMSPEQLSGARIDVRSDIFALGLLLYELATGRHPFGGDTPPLTASAILSAVPRPVAPGSPAALLQPIFAKMLARSPDDRYASLSECIDDLRALADRAPVVTPPRPRPSMRRPLAIGAALLLAVAAVVAGRSLAAKRGVVAAPPAADREAAGAPASRTSLTYWLEVQPSAGAPTFTSVGEQVLPGGARFRINVSVSTPGQIYLLQDDAPDRSNPTGLSIVFTGPVSRDTTTDWFRVTGRAATDHVWMIWSATPLDELAAIAPLYNPRDLGIVRDAVAANRVRALLARPAAQPAVATGNPGAVRATVSAAGTLIAHRLELQHG